MIKYFHMCHMDDLIPIFFQICEGLLNEFIVGKQLLKGDFILTLV